MIVDTSALIAILQLEERGDQCRQAIEENIIVRLSAANLLEAGIVVDGNREPVLSRRLDDLVRDADLIIEPVTAEQAQIARQAYRDFGKGSGHPAQLNFGDCFAYALARQTGEPLLFVGSDFIHTDIQPAVRW